MKKLASRGFTLVELMIVIAIIGILAAVLYPALTGYFERSRDTNRQGGLRNVALALFAYQSDKGQYPSINSNPGCVDDIKSSLEAGYMQKVPVDPKGSFGVGGCTSKGGYGYALVQDVTGAANAAYALAARVETRGNANFTGSTWSGVTSEKVGSGALQYVNQKGILADSAASSDWYYVVSQ